MMRGFAGPGAHIFAQGPYWWMGLISMAVHLIFWAVVIYIAYRLFKKYYKKPVSAAVKEDAAMAILRERFARGEIGAEEFEQRKAALEKTSTPEKT